MDYKHIIFENEERILSPHAQKSRQTLGRARSIEPCDFRTEFMRDRDKIIHCKAFRRLKHKTQVFLSPEGDHYRTRLTHTLEVTQIARTVARALRLNEDLTEAIALGHDLGHTPFGHAGEKALEQHCHFAHNEQSLRIVDVLENDFKGMNLTFEVRDGILNHTSKGNPSTLEGRVVSWADRIAYLNHDIDDAIRAGILSEDDIPKELSKVFGKSHGKRIDSMVKNLVDFSFNNDFVAFEPSFCKSVNELRQFMFDNVYTSKVAKGEEVKAIEMLGFLYSYYYEDLSRLPKPYQNLDATKEQKVCDFISTMTDRYAVTTFENLFVPKKWVVF